MIGNLRRRLTSIAKERVGPFVADRQPTRTDLPLSTWGLSIGPNGTLWRGSVDLDELGRRHGTPLHLVDSWRLETNARDAQRPGGADVFASYKTNPVPAVLRRLHDRGIGAEVISPYELWLALRLGVPGDRIIYNGPARSSASIRTAIRHDVLMINANSVSDAARISALAAEEQRVVHLGVRLSLPETWGGQFGLSTVDAAAGVIRAALDDPWVDLCGVHVHRGMTILDAATMTAYVAAVLERVDELREATGWHPRMLDLGGSLACPTVAPFARREYRLNRALGTDLLPPDPESVLRIGDASLLAVALVDEHARSVGIPSPRVILEPGRAMTGDTQLLLTAVVDVKDDTTLVHAILDAGMNIAEPALHEYHQLLSATAPGAAATTGYRLAGPICTPADVLYNHWRLPPLAPGHVLAIMDTGAYFVPFSTTFSFPKPAVLVQDGDEVTVGRRGESYDDMVGLDE